MKNLSILFVCLLLVVSSSFAQETAIVLDKKSANSFPLTFENYNKKNLEIEWKRYVKTFGGKVKKNKETKEFYAKNVSIKEISDKPVDIYATIFKTKKTSIITFWFSVDDAFIHPENQIKESTAINQLLSDFSTTAIANETARQLESGNITTNTKAGTIRNPITSREVETSMDKGCQHSTAPVED